MRLSMTVNGSNPIVASLPRPGYLSASLNLSDRSKENERQKTIRIAGIETGATETIHLKWPSVDLEIGGAVELRVLPDGEGNEPSEIRRSSESPYNLFSRPELARELLQAVSDFEERLNEIAARSKELETPDEYKKFGSAFASVAWELGRYFLYPVYRRRKELIPERLKGEIL